MPYDYSEQKVQCPFYSYQRERRLYCEGLMKNASSTITTFKGKKELHIHKSKHCNTSYKDCALYKALMKKYE